MEEKKYILSKRLETENKFEENENTRGMKNLIGVLFTCLSVVGVVASLKYSLPIAMIIASFGAASTLKTFRDNGIMKEQSEKLNQEINHLERVAEEGLDTSINAKKKRKARKAKLNEEIDELCEEYNNRHLEISIATIIALLSSFLTFISPYFMAFSVICLMASTIEGARLIGTNEKLQNKENRLDNIEADERITQYKEAELKQQKAANTKLIRTLPKLDKSTTSSKENKKAVDDYIAGLEKGEDTTTKPKTYTK